MNGGKEVKRRERSCEVQLRSARFFNPFRFTGILQEPKRFTPNWWELLMRNRHPLKLPVRSLQRTQDLLCSWGAIHLPWGSKTKANFLSKVQHVRRAACAQQRAETCRKLTVKELGCRMKRLLQPGPQTTHFYCTQDYRGERKRRWSVSAAWGHS